MYTMVEGYYMQNVKPNKPANRDAYSECLKEPPVRSREPSCLAEEFSLLVSSESEKVGPASSGKKFQIYMAWNRILH
jgi:hypothetical protein